ncbi:hypothetical protein LGM69_25370 [Burkholderia multivorans]|uniref:hypothetical protein n=1 Tax=Burkholderia sp. SRS-W-2-2016 TaxID=1926878 RepID=UPI00094AE790|nr:hypothetical protein [Burkholderia sp. SRS-W-2-2016]MCA8224809.1 hypothetical protein [Burkholderia multivorans]OLL33536.1 hypothetical protein BTH42_00640 [Burkholderia sp. SRS-W-2-2016]
MNDIIKHGLLLAVLLVFTALLFIVFNRSGQSAEFDLASIVASGLLTACVHVLLKDEPERGEE